MAAVLKSPELMLSDDESKSLAGAIAEVSAHYPVVADDKTLAWLNLTMVAGMVYGPRAVAIYMRTKYKPQEGASFEPSA